jgi:hypothetical protein
MSELPFAGRNVELAKLDLLFREAVSTGTGRLVVVHWPISAILLLAHGSAGAKQRHRASPAGNKR